MSTLISTNSSALSAIDATISIEEHTTPHLFALESLTIGSRQRSKNSRRASAVRKRFAPSTITRAGREVLFSLESDNGASWS